MRCFQRKARTSDIGVIGGCAARKSHVKAGGCRGVAFIGAVGAGLKFPQVYAAVTVEVIAGLHVIQVVDAVR